MRSEDEAGHVVSGAVAAGRGIGAGPERGSLRIWGFAFGYFAAYVPYTLLTKAVSSGGGGVTQVSGTAILPLATMTSVVGMVAFISLMRWWGYAAHVRLFGVRVPRPRLVTLMSGIATAAILLTTTLAYTFDGISVLFAMLLMRGGVLLLAPEVDQLNGRPFSTIPWWSWAGSGLALMALLVAFSEDGGAALTLVAAIDIAIYLVAYFFRLSWMSQKAKTSGREARIAFFVEEQMVATPVALVGLAVFASLGESRFASELAWGFSAIWAYPETFILVMVIGLCSQLTGVFGGLILLEPAENAYTVPVNRASSILAGVVSSYLALPFFDGEAPSLYELLGAGVVVVAIVVLSYPVLAARRRPAPSPEGRDR